MFVYGTAMQCSVGPARLCLRVFVVFVLGARSFNIRLAVKSTGHEYQGRSTAPSSLLIWMHTYREMDISDQFVACPGALPTPAITVRGGGATWGHVYAALASSPYQVVGGAQATVSACGGYTLGGILMHRMCCVRSLLYAPHLNSHRIDSISTFPCVRVCTMI